MKSIQITTKVTPRVAEYVRKKAEEKQLTVSKWIERELEKLLESDSAYEQISLANKIDSILNKPHTKELNKIFSDYRELFRKLANK